MVTPPTEVPCMPILPKLPDHRNAQACSTMIAPTPAERT
jgi:hypothetical protein